MKPTHLLGKVTQRQKYKKKHVKQGWKIIGVVFALVWAARARAGGRQCELGGRGLRTQITNRVIVITCYVSVLCCDVSVNFSGIFVRNYKGRK